MMDQKRAEKYLSRLFPFVGALCATICISFGIAQYHWRDVLDTCGTYRGTLFEDPKCGCILCEFQLNPSFLYSLRKISSNSSWFKYRHILHWRTHCRVLLDRLRTPFINFFLFHLWLFPSLSRLLRSLAKTTRDPNHSTSIQSNDCHDSPIRRFFR